MEIVDLLGIYFLFLYILEEVVICNFMLDDKLDVVINIVDVLNIERNLYFII